MAEIFPKEAAFQHLSAIIANGAIMSRNAPNPTLLTFTYNLGLAKCSDLGAG